MENLVDEIGGVNFEPYVSKKRKGKTRCIPLMEKYPSPANMFDIDFSNVEGEGDGEVVTPQRRVDVDPEVVAAAVAAGATLLGNIGANKDEIDRQIKNRCGRRPLFRKKREEVYQPCVDAVYRDLQRLNQQQQEQTDTKNYPPPPPKGLSTGAWVGIGLGVVAVTGFVIFMIRRTAK